MEVRPVYVSGCCNRTPHCMAWNCDNTFIFGCSNAVAVAHVDNHGSQATSRLLRTLSGHTGRVNCVRWLTDAAFVSASSDRTVRIWGKDDDNDSFESRFVLDQHKDSVTCVHGLCRENRYLIASASADSTVKMWNVAVTSVDQANQDAVSCLHTIPLANNGFALDLKLVEGPAGVVFLIMSLDNCQVAIYAASAQDQSAWMCCHTLGGHDDWVQSLSVVQLSQGGLCLATGGQDHHIRLWSVDIVSRPCLQEDHLGLIQMKKEEFLASGRSFAVTLDSVLSGHEDKVYGLKWHTGSPALRLLSCSLDKTMIVWMVDPDSGVWLENARVGDVGGNLPGFLGCDFSVDGRVIMGYSFNGAFHLWSQDDNGAWNPGVAVLGHFGPVEDLAWETKGRYLVSVSKDQTSRIHAPWPAGGWWCEVARPQVHGYDICCVTALPGHRFASGADEKIVRVFQATTTFLRNLRSISGLKQELDDAEMAGAAPGASVPSLGLSNKAVAGEESSNDEQCGLGALASFKAELHRYPAPEESLVQNSLWPELHKLYGHGNELFCVASDPAGRYVASACKASRPEHANIILWDAETWELLASLAGHTLTVIQMQFSPCGRYLLSVSRDRTWCLFQHQPGSQQVPFVKVACSDKRGGVHTRLLWSCCWTMDSQYFATASRDKKVAIWGLQDANKVSLMTDQPICLADAVTAVSFVPTCRTRYILAAGLESGVVVFIQWTPSSLTHWITLLTLTTCLAHHKAVRCIRFRPPLPSTTASEEQQEEPLLMATCGQDHLVKVFSVAHCWR